MPGTMVHGAERAVRARALTLTPMARKKAAGKTDGRERRERLSSVATAIRLLKAFSEDEVEIGISALARRLALAKSTVHRLAVTLVSEGLLEQNRENGKYQLGIVAFSARRAGAPAHERLERSAALPLRSARKDQRERASRDSRRD